ncbi:MAG: glycerophosphoryl diester phosphodiesterase membrane domain-containing protein [Anaerolineae bacterium]
MNESLSISLEPLKMGQMFDRAFRIYRVHFWKLIGIAAVAQIISFLFQSGIGIFSTISFGQSFQDQVNTDPFAIFDGSFAILIVLGILAWVVIIIAGLLTQAALVKGISQAMLGEEFTVSSAYQDILPSLGKLLLLTLALFGLAIAILIWFIIPCVGWFTGLGMLFFFGFVSAFAVPILILEGRNPGESITRAWFLARRRFWQVVGYALLLGLLTGVLTGGLGFLIGLGSQAALASNPSTGALIATQLVQVGFTTIITAIVTPFTIIAYLLFYFDLRVRTEGFDLTLKSQMNSGMKPADIVAITPNDTQESFITGQDMLNFFLLTLAFVAIYAVIFGILFGALMAMGPQVGEIFEEISGTLEAGQ